MGRRNFEMVEVIFMKHHVSRITDYVSAGFSLMELLIVIALIGILVSLGAASYTAAQKKTRDARRQADMKSIQEAFEQYYSDSSATYPTSASCTVDATYLPAGLPVDPKTGGAYTLTCDATGSTYCACATLEGATTGGNASDTSCTWGTGTYYCVINRQ